MKIKKSELNEIHELLEELSSFFVCSLDFIDDDQEEYVREIGNRIDKSIRVIKKLDK